MSCLVTVEEKVNAPWADDDTRRTSYTKRAFLPWNIIMMGRWFILVSPLGIGNKDCMHNHRHSFSDPGLKKQTTHSKYFRNLKDPPLIPQIKWKIVRQSLNVNSFNARCNLCIDEKISMINFKDRKLLLNEANELVFECRHENKFKSSSLGSTVAPTLNKNKDIDSGWFLLEIITFNLVITIII